MSPLKYIIRLLFIILLDYSQLEFDKCCTGQANYRDDFQCGADFPAPNGEDAICPCTCCSEWNWCGLTDDHCLCDNCLDQRNLSCPTTPPPTLPPEEPVYSVAYKNLIGKCLVDASGSVMQLYTRSSSRCARACLAFISMCNAFGFDQRFSRNSDCFLYNTTSWELVDVETNVSKRPRCLFYVMEYK